MTQNDTAVYAPPTALGPSITVREAQQAVLRICADTEFSTPQPHAWTYIIMSVAAAVSAMRHFIHSISYPRYRPYLAVVRVPAQLKVNARALGLFKMRVGRSSCARISSAGVAPPWPRKCRTTVSITASRILRRWS